MEPVYHVPLIPQDLRQEESILQIADVLQHLNNVINDVFKRIDDRIDQNMIRTKKVAERIEACSRVVEQLAGTNKATKIYCSAKYPAMDCHANYECVFNHGEPMTIMRNKKEIKSKPGVYTDKELQDKLEFYHVKLSCPDPLEFLLGTSLPRNTGQVPQELNAAGALLLHGTEELAYGGGGRGSITATTAVPAREVSERGTASPLHEAPATVASRGRPSNREQDLYMYSPDMGEAPSMDMPQDLPHLSGVAGDMRFLSEAEPTIAPSARSQGGSVPPPSEASQPQVVNVTDQPRSQPVQTNITAPLVMEQKPPQQERTPEAREIRCEGPSAPPPPPPPPPPLPQPAGAATHVEETDSSTETSRPVKVKNDQPPVVGPGRAPALDSRANLMEAIRKAGGSGKARLRPTTSDEPQKDAGKPSGGDLMADLHAKLSMRRKGISGAGAGRGAAEGTILAAISAMVPPPAPREPDTRSNSELSSADDDWD